MRDMGIHDGMLVSEHAWCDAGFCSSTGVYRGMHIGISVYIEGYVYRDIHGERR